MSVRNSQVALDGAAIKAQGETGDAPFPALLTGPVADKMGAAVIGTIVGINAAGLPIVTCPAKTGPRGIAARSCVSLDPHSIGRDVVLVFADGNVHEPIVVGVLKQARVHADRGSQPVGSEHVTCRQVQVDGERTLITADREIVLHCGEASITLTREGKILLRGAYLSSRSTGVNRIKGGSIEIN